jgi:alkyl hydroperoxide reductase subunit AhpF
MPKSSNAKDAYDVLVVGGGPAGAAAAIYAARKGIRTGVVAERFGGQVLDTLGIENFISVQRTEGPKLAMALEQHVKEYEVDIMNLQRAEALVPAGDDGLAQVRLANGATLKAKSVILATGARWREMNVPGEKEYKAKGVCFCPHCDGPLFKGKRVAVIGGGNSGVEAAIDLAGIVSHVTLLEFDSKLRADAVLQAKLGSLPNVTVIVTSALTTEVTGDGEKVNGIVYRTASAGRRSASSWKASSSRSACCPTPTGSRARWPFAARRDRDRRARPDLAARRLRRRRRDDHALQADHHRHGRRREGQPLGLRPPDPQSRARADAGAGAARSTPVQAGLG